MEGLKVMILQLGFRLSSAASSIMATVISAEKMIRSSALNGHVVRLYSIMPNNKKDVLATILVLLLSEIFPIGKIPISLLEEGSNHSSQALILTVNP